MKKTFALLCLVVCLFALTVPCLAAQFNVTGDYLDGNYTWNTGFQENTAKASGFLLEGDATLAGPLGASLSYATLNHNDFTYDGQAADPGWKTSGKMTARPHPSRNVRPSPSL